MMARRAWQKWPKIVRQRPSSPALQTVPSPISRKRSWFKAFMEFRGVFMKYPG
jgi:hypothetical protein